MPRFEAAPRSLMRWSTGLLLGFAAVAGAQSPGVTARVVHPASCRAVSFEGEVGPGQAFRKIFSPGLEFFLEPLASGWIIRVLAMKDGREQRGAHDWAEVATPPYRSPNPLLISTDWAFRAQDAAAWNPREFHFAADGGQFARLSGFEDRVLAGDAAAQQDLLSAVMSQPQGKVQLLDVKLLPGTQDQTRMAAAVASHWDDTPHEVVHGQAPSPLGRLLGLRFRVTLELPGPAKGLPGETPGVISCAFRPTA